MIKFKNIFQFKSPKRKKAKVTEDNFMLVGTIGNRDLIQPDALIEKKDYLYLGWNRYVRTYGLLVIPLTYVGIFNTLYNTLGENIDSVSYVSKIKEREAIAYLGNEIAVVGANAKLARKRGTVDNAAEEMKASLEETQRLVQTGREKLFYVRKTFRIFGDTKEELDYNSKVFEDTIEGQSMQAKCFILNQAETFLSALPTSVAGLPDKEYKRNFTTEGLAGLFPTGFNGIYHKNGIFFGYTLSTQDIIQYDFFYGKDGLTNPMTIILGKKGSGKSVTEKLIISRGASNNAWVFVFDLEGESEKITRKLGGQVVTIKPGIKSGINPLELTETFDSEDGYSYVNILEKVTDTRENLNVFSIKFRGAPLHASEITVLDEVIRELYEIRGITEDANSLYEMDDIKGDDGYVLSRVKKRMPIYSELRENLLKYEATKNLAEAMKIITGNGSLSLFDCESTVDLRKGGVVCFSLKGVNDTFSKLYSIISLFDFLWSILGSWEFADIEKLFLLDELWFFAAIEEAFAKIENFERRGRKFKVSLIMATHFITELIATDTGKAILNLCETKILMGNSPESSAEIADYFKLPKGSAEKIQTFKEGECMLVNSQERTSMKFKLFDFEKEYMET